MKYIEEGAKAVHKADLVHLLDTCGVEVQDKDRLNKLTLVQLLELVCKTNPEAAQQLKLDEKTVSRVREKYACERKIGKIRLAKKMGFKMEKKDDRIRLNMLYRLMKISRREKGFEDVSEIETVSVLGTPSFKKSNTAFISPDKHSRHSISLSDFSTAAQSPQTSQMKRSSTSPAVKRGRPVQKKTCTSSCKQRCQRIPSVLGSYGRRALAFLKNPLQKVRRKRQVKRNQQQQKQAQSKTSLAFKAILATAGVGGVLYALKEGVQYSGFLDA